MYTADYDDRLPAKGPWLDNLQPYLKNPDIHCPSLATGPDRKAKASGYAFNAFLAGADTGKMTDKDKKPLLYETRILEKNVWGYLTDTPNPGRHEGKCMFVFVDGHCNAVGGSTVH
jgi:prepilin-type processing-associated H-X9-DG protein